MAVEGHLGTHCRSRSRKDGARLVLLGAAAPGEAHTLATDQRAVLFKSGFGTAAVRELNKATTLANRNLNVNEFSIGLEVTADVSTKHWRKRLCEWQEARRGASRVGVRLEILLVHRGVEVADEHRGVVGVSGLRDLRSLEGLLVAACRCLGVVLAPGCCVVDAHGAARTELALHLHKRTVHLILREKPNEAIPTRHASLAVRDHLRTLDRLVSLGKGLLKDEVVHLRG